MAGSQAHRPNRSNPAASRNVAVGVLILLIIVALGYAAFGRSGGNGTRQPTVSSANQIEVGRQVYVTYCAACHGANLQGQPNWRTPLVNGSMPAPPHDQTGHTWHHPDQQLFEITKYGGQRFSPQGYVNLMPGYEGQLSDDQIWAVLAYIKSSWPPEVAAAQPKE